MQYWVSQRKEQLNEVTTFRETNEAYQNEDLMCQGELIYIFNIQQHITIIFLLKRVKYVSRKGNKEKERFYLISVYQNPSKRQEH